MPRRPTIDDVAAHAGVSKGTVSFVFNGRAGVAQSTKERVLASVEELDWTPHRRARSLSTSRADALGLVLARDPVLLGADPFFAPFIGGVESVLAPLGQSLLMRFVAGDAAEQTAYQTLSRESHVDGVILADLRRADPRIALARELGLPAVTLNRPTVRSEFPAVCVDDKAGIAAAVAHLAELGHTHIAHVGGPEVYLHATGRRRAWERAMRRHGLEPTDFIAADFTAAGGAAATRTLLNATQRPTAVIYANDLMAISGMAAAQQLGLEVPADLSIVGFDDAELSAYLHPALTTVRTDAFGFGVAAAQTLLTVIEGGPPADRELPAAQLVVRDSTAWAGERQKP
jgi:DNA-binding LacI/PurR family transcriptional regulator